MRILILPPAPIRKSRPWEQGLNIFCLYLCLDRFLAHNGSLINMCCMNKRRKCEQDIGVIIVVESRQTRRTWKRIRLVWRSTEKNGAPEAKSICIIREWLLMSDVKPKEAWTSVIGHQNSFGSGEDLYITWKYVQSWGMFAYVFWYLCGYFTTLLQ